MLNFVRSLMRDAGSLRHVFVLCIVLGTASLTTSITTTTASVQNWESMDLAILVYASSSTNFDVIKSGVVEMLRNIPIDSPSVQIQVAFAVVTTAGLNIRFGLNDFSTSNDIINGINGQAYGVFSAFDIITALGQLHTSIFSSGTSAQNVVWIVTDTDSSEASLNQASLTASLISAQNEGVRAFFSWGYGSGVSEAATSYLSFDQSQNRARDYTYFIPSGASAFTDNYAGFYQQRALFVLQNGAPVVATTTLGLQTTTTTAAGTTTVQTTEGTTTAATTTAATTTAATTTAATTTAPITTEGTTTIAITTPTMGTVDPCLDENHVDHYNQAWRNIHYQSMYSLHRCDDDLRRAWIRFHATHEEVEGEDDVAPTSPVNPHKCGTNMPVWINGTLPTSPSQGVVRLQACVVTSVSTCHSSWEVGVARCNGFYVYELIDTSMCDSAYCIGVEELTPDVKKTIPVADPCEEVYHADIRSQSWRNVHYETGDASHCDNKPTESWVRFHTEGNDKMPTEAVPPGRCGTQYPVWINGSLPSSPDAGVVSVPACVSVPGDSCNQTWRIHVKRCSNNDSETDVDDNFWVYYLPGTQGCDQAYCVDTQVPAPTTTTTTIMTSTSSIPGQTRQSSERLTTASKDVITVTLDPAPEETTRRSTTRAPANFPQTTPRDIPTTTRGPGGQFSQAEQLHVTYGHVVPAVIYTLYTCIMACIVLLG